MQTLTRYIDLDNLFVGLSLENPKLVFSATCAPYKWYGSEKKKTEKTVTYTITLVGKKYYVKEFFFVSSFNKYIEKGYTNKENVKADIKEDLARGNFKDSNFELNYESDTMFEEKIEFTNNETKETVKVSELFLLGVNYQYHHFLGFGVPVNKKNTARYQTLYNWVGGKQGGIRVIQNTSIRGIKRLGVTSRYSTSNKFIEYFDPRGFILQLSANDSNQLTKDLEELGTSLESTECVWDCSGRSPKICPVNLYDIQYVYGELTTEQEKQYLKEENKNAKINVRLLNLFKNKYICLSIESIEFPGLFVVFNIESKKLVYLSNSKIIELYTSNLESLEVFPLTDELENLEENITQKLLDSGKFVESTLLDTLLEKYNNRNS